MAPNHPKTLGERVAWARSVVNLAGAELERLAGIGETNIHFIENPAYARIPGGDNLLKIARVLGTTTDWLLDGSGKAPTVEQIAVAVVRAREAWKAEVLQPTGTGEG